MRRSTLLRALADAMPADGIRFGAAIDDIVERPDGAHHYDCKLLIPHSGCSDMSEDMKLC